MTHHQPPSLGSINLLEWLPELRAILAYVEQFIKGYDKGHKEEMHRVRCWGGGEELPCLPRVSQPRNPESLTTGILWRLPP